jgi:hypothetical protein
MAPLLAEWNKFIEYRFPLRTVGATTSAGAGAAAGGSAVSTGAQAAAKGSMAAGVAAGAAGGAAKSMSSVGKVSLVALGKRVAFDQILL